ncbi:MAG: RecB family exonuclease [Vicinamibacteria bacterium]
MPPLTSDRHRADITPTKLRELQRCPQRAFFVHGLGLADPGHEAREVGGIVHDVLARVARERLGVAEPSARVQAAELRRALEDRGGSPGAVVRAAELLDALAPELSFAHTVAAKERWQLRLGHDEESGLPIVAGGRWDRVDRLPDGTTRIVDYRTGRLLGRAELRFDDQVGLRLAAARARWPEAPRVEALVWWVDQDARVTVPWTRREDEFARLRARIGYRQLRRGDQTPRLGAHCADCPFRGRCDAYQEELRRLEAAPPDRAQDGETPRRLLEERERLKQVAALAEGARRDLDERIRRRIGDRGELRAGDLRAKLVTRRRRDVSPRVLRTLATSLDRDPLDLLEEVGQVSATKLRTLLDGAPEEARRAVEAQVCHDATSYVEVREVAPLADTQAAAKGGRRG